MVKKIKKKIKKTKAVKRVLKKAVRGKAKAKTFKIEEMPKIAFKIENIVASANLAVELDLYGIAREVDNVEYEPEQFPGAILKLKNPKTSLLLFKNGKLICTGAKSEAEVEKAINTAFTLIKHCIKH
jgi:transcription initiation factor TFIID TATA-box-binding protein